MDEATQKPTILFIVGSLRKQSFNRQMAEEARSIIGDRAETSILEWADVPVFNQDAEFPTPEAVKRVREEVAAADALWLATPEYNSGVPGGFKNLIDWLSRPLEDGSPAVINGKIATCSTVAGGSVGRYVQAAVIPTFNLLKLEMVRIPNTTLGFNREEFTTNKMNFDETAKADLTRQVNALLAKL